MSEKKMSDIDRGVSWQEEMIRYASVRHAWNETFAGVVYKYQQKRGISDAMLRERTHISPQTYGNVVRRGMRPSRDTVMIMIFGLMLDEEEAEELLATVGCTFDDTDERERSIKWLAEEKSAGNDFYKTVTADDLDMVFYDCGLKTLFTK